MRAKHNPSPSMGLVLGLGAVAAVGAMIYASRKAKAEEDKSEPAPPDTGSPYVAQTGRLLEVAIPLPAEHNDEAREAIIQKARDVAGPRYVEMQANVEDQVRFGEIRQAVLDALDAHPDMRAILVRRSNAGGQVWCPYDPNIKLEFAIDRYVKDGDVEDLKVCNVFSDDTPGAPLNPDVLQKLQNVVDKAFVGET